MKLTKNDKKELSKELGEELKAKDAFFAAFQGLKFKDINGLREILRSSRSRFKVVRNTVISHALESAALNAGDKNAVKGPTAVITIENPDDIARTAKTLLAFAKENPALKVKGGFASSKWLSSSDLEKLSKIGSKTELLGKLAGTLYSNLAQIRFVLEAPMRDLVYALDAVKEKNQSKK